MMLRLFFGLLLGVFFYGGLSLTVRHLAVTHHPFAVMLASLLLRSAATLAGFCVLIAGEWLNAVWALIGFSAARFLLRAEGKKICT